MTIGLYLSFSRSFPNHLRMFVPLLPWRSFGSSDDNRITTSQKNSLVSFSCTVVVPYELVRIMDRASFRPTFFHSMTS
jgi:hypothetical protein